MAQLGLAEAPCPSAKAGNSHSWRDRGILYERCHYAHYPRDSARTHAPGRPGALLVTQPIISSKAKRTARRRPAIPSSSRLSHCPGPATSCWRGQAVLATEGASALAQEGQTRSHSPRKHRKAPRGRRVRIEDYHNGGKSRRRPALSNISKPFFTPSLERPRDGPVAGRQHPYGRKPASSRPSGSGHWHAQ